MNKSEEILNIAIYEEDYDFIASQIETLVDSNEPFTFASGVIAIGHLARRFGSYPDNLLQRFRTRRKEFDNRQVTGAFIDTYEDIEYFCGIVLKD